MRGEANPQFCEAGERPGLTAEADVSVGQRQERGVQRVVGVTEDGVPLVNLLHHSRVQAVLLRNRGAVRASARVVRRMCICSLTRMNIFLSLKHPDTQRESKHTHESRDSSGNVPLAISSVKRPTICI